MCQERERESKTCPPREKERKGGNTEKYGIGTKRK